MRTDVHRCAQMRRWARWARCVGVRGGARVVRAWCARGAYVVRAGVWGVWSTWSAWGACGRVYVRARVRVCVC